jgi:hypothetical protein
MTGFMMACAMNSNADAIKYLANEFDINHTNSLNRTGFMLACAHNANLDVIICLVDDAKRRLTRENEFNMYLNHVDNDDDTGFSLSFDNANFNVTKYLYEHKDIILSCNRVAFSDFSDLIRRQNCIHDYIRFNDLIISASVTHVYSGGPDRMRNLLLDINPLMIKKQIIKKFELSDPLELKFKKFVKLFEFLPTNIKIYYANQ